MFTIYLSSQANKDRPWVQSYQRCLEQLSHDHHFVNYDMHHNTLNILYVIWIELCADVLNTGFILNVYIYSIMNLLSYVNCLYDHW